MYEWSHVGSQHERLATAHSAADSREQRRTVDPHACYRQQHWQQLEDAPLVAARQRDVQLAHVLAEEHDEHNEGNACKEERNTLI